MRDSYLSNYHGIAVVRGSSVSSIDVAALDSGDIDNNEIFAKVRKSIENMFLDGEDIIV